MTEIKYRPWGRPEWLTSSWEQSGWVVIGCLGTEKRSAQSISRVGQLCNKIHLIEIVDPLNFDDFYRASIIADNLRHIQSRTAAKTEHQALHLKSSLDDIEQLCDEIASEAPNIVLDITSFPKRWFFPMVRELLQHKNVANLQIAYTKGAGYAPVLSENPETLRVIHGFPCLDGRTEHDLAFVGVGFHTQGMVSMFGSDNAKSLQMLFPFPPGPPSTKKNWRFVQQVERIIQRDENLDEQLDPIKFIHTDANDISHVFDIMRIKTDNGRKTSMMAPYGPKSFSLAMCLFSIAADGQGRPDIPVFYAQPQRYATDYTKSAAIVAGKTDTWSYAVKHKNQNLYEII